MLPFLHECTLYVLKYSGVLSPDHDNHNLWLGTLWVSSGSVAQFYVKLCRDPAVGYVIQTDEYLSMSCLYPVTRIGDHFLLFNFFTFFFDVNCNYTSYSLILKDEIMYISSVEYGDVAVSYFHKPRIFLISPTKLWCPQPNCSVYIHVHV